MKTKVYTTSKRKTENSILCYEHIILYTTKACRDRRSKELREYGVVVRDGDDLDVPLLFPYCFKINDETVVIEDEDEDPGFVLLGEIIPHENYTKPMYISRDDEWAANDWVNIYCLKANIKEAKEEFEKLSKSRTDDKWFKIWNTTFDVHIANIRRGWGESGN